MHKHSYIIGSVSCTIGSIYLGILANTVGETQHWFSINKFYS